MQLAFWAAAFALGISFAVAAGQIALWIVAAIAVLAVVPLMRQRAWNTGMAVIAVFCGVGLGNVEVFRTTAPAQIEEDKPSEIVAEIVRGADVSDEPAVSGSADPVGTSGGKGDLPSKRCHLLVDVRTVDGGRVTARAALTVVNGVPDLAPGDSIQFLGRLYLPIGYANPGLPDSRMLARAQGIDLLATVRSSADLHKVQGRTSFLSSFRRCAFRLRQAMSRAINHRLSEPAAGFVRTMVVGERTDVPAQVEDGFRAAGATHVLSVSGLHLAVVAALVFQFLHRLVARFPSWSLRIPPKALASALSLPAVGFYTLLTGEAVATVRSAIMASIVLGAAVINRPLSLAASIAAAAVVLLSRSPLALLDVSFQLSFASVIGLGLFARWLLPLNSPRVSSRSRRALGWLLRSLSASFAASLVTLPLVAHHFGEITPAAPVGNLALVPIVELVVLPCGLVGSLLALVQPWLGALPLLAAGWASRLALELAEIFRQFAPVILVRFPNWCETLLLVCAAACLLRAWMAESLHRMRWFLLGGAALVLALGSLFVRDAVRRTSSDLRLTFIDVGQGDSALIEGPAGFVALIDGGGHYDNSFDTGARIVEPVLRARGITKLDLVILSHPHPDHMNGLFRILRRFPVGALWTQGDAGDNPAYWDLINLARERGVPTPSPGSFASSGLVVEALGPRVGNSIAVPAGLGANDASLVVRFSYAGRRVLFTGDIGRDGEAELLGQNSAGMDLTCDILKMPHHGSRYSSSAEFLAAVLPRWAVASAGRYNRFNLPNPIAIERYVRRGIQVLRTDHAGAVTSTIEKLGAINLTCARGCQP
jgi:competence protein ComEC